MAKKLAIPEDHREWPDWEYRPFPKWLGRDAVGEDIIANSEAEIEEHKDRVVYPKAIGLDDRGKVLQVMHPDEESLKKNQVRKPLPDAVDAAPALTKKAK